MGSRQFRPSVRKARAILSTRDYDAARKQLKQALKQPGWLRAAGLRRMLGWCAAAMTIGHRSVRRDWYG